MDIQSRRQAFDWPTVIITVVVMAFLAWIAYAIWFAPKTTEAGPPATPPVKTGQPAPATPPK
jgi:threonine/homoserine/homoserine lactone efflux protein